LLKQIGAGTQKLRKAIVEIGAHVEYWREDNYGQFWENSSSMQLHLTSFVTAELDTRSEVTGFKTWLKPTN
jgi:hypothetical protein